MSTVVGREPELAAVRGLLDQAAGGPAVLVLAGEAGIGKTTVWRAGVETAGERGFAVLACRPAAAEVRLSYAGLADLLAEVGSQWFDLLPRPQRRGLDAALLRGSGDDPAPDPRAVAAGLLSVLDGLARTAPVLVAIDDVQWLDRPTHEVVGFAVRRCSGPVAVLVARRDDDQRTPEAELRPRDPDRVRTVRLGPLSLGALHHLIAERTGRAMPRPALVRLVETSGGNPFFALELARSADLRAPAAAALPDSLRAVVSDRLARLDPSIREALLVVSALAAPRIDLVERALEDRRVAMLLGAAEDQGVVDLSPDGSVSFTHPLLATGAYAEAAPSARRALHRRLSAVIDDAEERARHLALAAIGPDPEVVCALDAAAVQARRRGAPAAAAELLELAIVLGDRDPHLRVQAAQDHFHAGNPDRARELVVAAIADLRPGPARAEALALLGAIHLAVGAAADASDALEQALAEAATDAALRCSIALELCFVAFNLGRIDTVLPARTAVEAARQVGDDGLLAEALSVETLSRFFVGEVPDEAAFAPALELEDRERHSRAMSWPTLHAAFVALWCSRIDKARAGLAAARQRCLDQGAESELWLVLPHAVSTACSAGDIEAAQRYADELVEHAQLVGTAQSRAFACSSQAELSAWVGRVDEARAAGEEALTLFARSGVATFSLPALAAVGMAELSVGDHQATAERLVPAAEAMVSMGIREPTVFPFLPDAVEALVALGRLDEAEPVVALLQASGRRPDRAWSAAVGARCRGLLLAAQGRPDEAQATFEHALGAHDRLPELRYGRARTLLACGRHQGRRRRRRAARASLVEAARLFDEVGCRRWAANARAEVDRLGLTPGAGDELTAAEQRIAELVASGLTVREAAAALIVSPKTVEAHLTRVYRKLGIHSRAELGQRMAVGTPPEPSGTRRAPE